MMTAIIDTVTKNLLRYSANHLDHDLNSETVLHTEKCTGKRCFSAQALYEEGEITFHRWNGSDFDLITEQSENYASIAGNINEYATLMIANGFTGDPQSVADIEAWLEAEIDACTTLDELKAINKVLFKTAGRAITALSYGWKL